MVRLAFNRKFPRAGSGFPGSNVQHIGMSVWKVVAITPEMFTSFLLNYSSWRDRLNSWVNIVRALVFVKRGAKKRSDEMHGHDISQA
jgi:hypothetical protein